MKGRARQKIVPGHADTRAKGSLSFDTRTPAQLFVGMVQGLEQSGEHVEARITPDAFYIDVAHAEIEIPRTAPTTEEVEKTALRTWAWAMMADAYAKGNTSHHAGLKTVGKSIVELLDPTILNHVSKLAENLDAVAAELEIPPNIAAPMIIKTAQRIKAPLPLPEYSIQVDEVNLNTIAAGVELPVHMALLGMVELAALLKESRQKGELPSYKDAMDYLIGESNPEVDEPTFSRDDPDIVDTAEAITAARAILSRVFPAERVGKALEDLATGGDSAGTDDPATAKPRPEDSVSAERDAKPHAPEMAAAAEVTQRRPKWKPDLGLTAAQFAAQAYAAEFASGTFDKSIIRRDDKTLYQRLYREAEWDELAALTESSIPTKSGRRRAEKVEAVQAIGLPAEQAELVLATVEQNKRQNKSIPERKARFG